MIEDTLTKPQIDILTQQLISSRNELNRLLKLSESSSEIVELDQSKVGRLSRIDAMQQQQMASAGKRAQQKQLSQTNKALKKIEIDEYGFCIDCDEVIAFSRLQIKPESERCINCQQAHEK